jgi:hypothetical protein
MRKGQGSQLARDYSEQAERVDAPFGPLHQHRTPLAERLEHRRSGTRKRIRANGSTADDVGGEAVEQLARQLIRNEARHVEREQVPPRGAAARQKAVGRLAQKGEVLRGAHRCLVTAICGVKSAVLLIVSCFMQGVSMKFVVI